VTALLINSLADEGTLASPDHALRDTFSDGSFPKGWEFEQLTTVAQLESGHTPSPHISRACGFRCVKAFETVAD